MSDFLREIVKKLGIYAAPTFVVFFALVWAVVHLTAKPGDKISVLWGMLDYTKGAIPAVAPRSNLPPLDNTDAPKRGANMPTNPQKPTAGGQASEGTAGYEPVFYKDNIVPRAFAGAKSGRPLSLIRAAFPSPPGFTSHDKSKSFYEFPVSKGPFKRILFYFDDKIGDPIVNRVSFIIRDKQAADSVKNSALAALDWKCAETTATGAIVWSGGCYGGYNAKLDAISFTID